LRDFFPDGEAASYLGDFSPSYVSGFSGTRPAMLFIFNGRQILIKDPDGEMSIPLETDFSAPVPNLARRRYIGVMGGKFGGAPCYFIEESSGEAPEKDMRYGAIRELSAQSEELFRVAGFAYHLMNWTRINLYCGRCGAQLRDKSDELARECPSCGAVIYPRISPAVITAVTRGDEILLAHNRSFRDGFYGLISGFVEPGETLEDCVRREIMEETGLEVKNIRYFDSQPWPFPDSLMAAFTAEYAGGELHPDGDELSDAKWFRGGNMPLFPGPDSIAGRMIRRFLASHKGDGER